MMKRKTISTRQGIYIMSMFIIGSSVIIGVGGKAKNDVWLAIIIAILSSLVVSYIYSQILNSFPGIDFIDILKKLFGRFLGRIIGVVFVWFSFHLGSLVIRDFGEFIKTVGLPNTPNSIIMAFAAILATISVRSGIEMIGRACEVFFLAAYKHFIYYRSFLIT